MMNAWMSIRMKILMIGETYTFLTVGLFCITGVCILGLARWPSTLDLTCQRNDSGNTFVV
jgi:hypothetical protein